MGDAIRYIDKKPQPFKVAAVILVHPSRFERETSGLGSELLNHPTNLTPNGYNDDKDCEADPWAVSVDTPSNTIQDEHEVYQQNGITGDLAEVIVLWPKLPGPIKVGITAMVRAVADAPQ